MAVPNAPTIALNSQISYNTIPGEIFILWFPNNDPASLINYKIYRGLSAGSVSLVATQSATGPIDQDPPPNAYNDTTPVVGTTYFYRVTATNVDGESAQSAAISRVAQSLTTLGTPSWTTTDSIVNNDPGSVGIVIYEGFDELETPGVLDDFYLAEEGNFGVPSGFDISLYAEYNDPSVYMKFKI